MSWLSILPPQLATLETWLVRIFLTLAILTIGPWLLFILYDLLLYLIRTLLYEVPYFGGRAHGEQRPRPPSLSERPDGRPRRVSLVGGGSNAARDRDDSLQPRRSGEFMDFEDDGIAAIAGDADRRTSRGAVRRRTSGERMTLLATGSH